MVGESDVNKAVIKSEQEWRRVLFNEIKDISEKMDRMDKEMATFKVRVLVFASLFGGASGTLPQVVKSIFNLP